MRGTCELFCPHCDAVIEILGEPPKGELQCDCGGVLERFEVDDQFELTPTGIAALERLAPFAAAYEAAMLPRRKTGQGG